jgi:hypothetical protein
MPPDLIAAAKLALNAAQLQPSREQTKTVGFFCALK